MRKLRGSMNGTKKTRTGVKIMKVNELIEHLKTIDQGLEVFFTMFDDGYHFYPLGMDDVVESKLEDYESGKEFSACIIGEKYNV
jgi:hypothetical protein